MVYLTGLGKTAGNHDKIPTNSDCICFGKPITLQLENSAASSIKPFTHCAEFLNLGVC
jgi:hypothetical protein